MKIQLAGLLLTLIGSSLALAQEPAIPRIDVVATPTIPATAIPATVIPETTIPAATIPQSSSLSALQITPEMWLYIQEQRRHDDPAQAVRRKAEYQASQRQTRLASAKWYGYSNSRPETSPIPTMGLYSTGWTGTGLNRYEWIGSGTPYVAMYGGWFR